MASDAHLPGRESRARDAKSGPKAGAGVAGSGRSVAATLGESESSSPTIVEPLVDDVDEEEGATSYWRCRSSGLASSGSCIVLMLHISEGGCTGSRDSVTSRTLYVRALFYSA